MLKKIRKHNKWLMVGFGVLLMVTWLIQPAINQFNSAYQSRVVAKLDGKKITARQMNDASRELSAITELLPGPVQSLGLADRDPVHWLMLTREAEDAGMIGGPADGESWDMVVGSLATQLAFSRYRDFAPQILRMPQMFDQLVQEARPQVQGYIRSTAGRQQMTEQQIHTALARARGVFRLIDAYRNAGRMSDRASILKAREYLDAAKVNYVFIPAPRLADSIPDPDAAALQAHFDFHKSIKPGEGDHGVGYLLPARVKLEWMKLDRTAIDAAVTLDPVEVRRRYNQGNAAEPRKYPGEFAAERSRIEGEMKGEIVEKVMQEAHVCVQTEILKATKILEPEGRFKKLPADWDANRPKFEAVAQAVVEGVRKATGVTIPLPPVTVKASDWLTRDDLQALPDIGSSQMRAGGLQIPFADIVFWTRELPGAEEGLIPVQTAVPVSESFLTDFSGSRYYLTVLATRGESAPDSIDEKREQIIKDYKSIKAFEQLSARADELRSKAVSGGLEAIIADFPAAEAPKPATPDAQPPEDPKFKPLEIVKDITVGSDVVGNTDPVMNTNDTYKKVLEAALKIDPLLPREQVPADAATLCLPVPKRLGLAVIRIINPDPVTAEKYRQFQAAVITESQRRELAAAAPKPEDDPFSFANLLKRHTYTSGDRDIRTPEELKKEQEGPSGG